MHRPLAILAFIGFGLAACGGSPAAPGNSGAESAPSVPATADATPRSTVPDGTASPSTVDPGAAALHGTWDYANDEAGREVILANFAGLVDSADEVVTRIAFDGDDWWQGFLFDGELFLLDGVPEGDAGSFSIDPRQPVIVMTGAHGQARITYEWAIEGDSLTLTAIEECVVAEAEETCVDDPSEMDPIMLLVTDQTFTRSGDDPGY